MFRNGSSEDWWESSANNDPINATFNKNVDDIKTILVEDIEDKQNLFQFVSNVL